MSCQRCHRLLCVCQVPPFGPFSVVYTDPPRPYGDYHKSPDVEILKTENERLQARIERLEGLVAALNRRIETLENERIARVINGRYDPDADPLLGSP